MFSNAFQSGSHVEVFDSKVNKEKNEFYAQLYKTPPGNGVKRDFDKQIKGYLFELEGQTTKMTFPKDDHKELCLVQQYLILQIYIPQGFPWSLELTITDTSKTKRRVNLTTAVSKSQVKYFHVKQPIDHRVKRNTWLNLAIDCYSFMAAWKGQTYRSLDQIVLGSYCKIRRIFTMREKLIEFSNDDEAFEPNQIHGGVFVPKSCQLNPDVLQSTQVIVYEPAEDPNDKSLKENSVSHSLGNSSVKTTKKQPSIHAVLNQEKKTVPNRLYIPQPPVSKNSRLQKPQSVAVVSSKLQMEQPSQINSLAKSTLSASKNLEKHHYTIPEHKEDEESDQMNDPQKQLKRELAKYSDKKQKFEPIGRAKKVFLSDAEQMPKSAAKKVREEQPAKIELVKVKDQQKSDEHLVKSRSIPEKGEQNFEEVDKESQVFDEFEGKSSDFNYQNQGFQDSLEKENQDQKTDHKLEQVKANAQKLHSFFPTSIITKKNKQTVVVEVKGGKDIELIYDDVLECYYDPQANVYYTIN